MKRFEEVLALIKSEALARRGHLGTEVLTLEAVVGRVSAEPVESAVFTPAEDNSAMDGFAVRSAETAKASSQSPVRLRVRSTVLAGDAPSVLAPEDLSCVEIMTGAPIPSGYDAVVKIEDTICERSPDGQPRVRIARPVVSGEHVRSKGLDYSPGKQLFASGVCLGPEHVLALASVGVTRVRVVRKARVALISTGAEIVDPATAPLLPGKVRNSTASHLISALPLHGAELDSFHHCGDDPEEFLETLERVLARGVDVILTTGAVSKGKKDYVPEVSRRAGARSVFHEVAIRPGKPGFFAAFEGGPVLFGMPGNPVSTAVALRFFVGAYLRELVSLAPEKPWFARLKADQKKPEGLRCFYKAKVDLGLEVEAHAAQPSFMVSPLLESNAWVILPEEGELVEKGALLSVYPLHPNQAIPLMDRESGCCVPTEGCC